jgi:hypothetical protein
MQLLRITTFFLVGLFASFSLYAQTFFPDLELENLHIISMVNMGDDGQLIIAEHEAKSTIELLKLNDELELKWRTKLKYDKPGSKKSPSKIQVLYNDTKIFWINETDKIRVAVIDQAEGVVLQSEKIIVGTEAVLEQIHYYTLNEDQLVVASNDHGSIQIIQADPFSRRIKAKNSIAKVGHQKFKQIAFMNNQTIHSYSYQVNRLHSEMAIEFSTHDLNGKELNKKKHELSLKHFSFAFNSSYDKNLLHIYPVTDGFIMFGKMDYRFNKRFVEKPEESRFAGFWIAKFDQKMDLLHKHEYPFSFFQNQITNSEFPNESLVDVKEDANGNFFLNFSTEPGGLLSQHSVIFYLNKELLFQSIHSGKMGRSFFDYNKFGVRTIAHNSNLRVINDDWRYYATNFLPFVRPIPHMHSPVLYTLNKMSKTTGVHEQDFAYNLVPYNDEFDYVFEYVKHKKSTTFRAYKLPKSMFKL